MCLKYIMFTLLATVIVVSADPNIDDCEEPIAIYKDLRCEPVYAKHTDKCPLKFDCSNMQHRPKDNCTYHGKVYGAGEMIPNKETYGNCWIGCRCRRNEEIICGILDCPEWIGTRPKPDHYFTYVLDECCTAGQKTAPFVTCEVDAVVYKEGQRFRGPGRCTNCICGEGWSGKFEPPFCSVGTCAEEINNLHNIKANCAPVYMLGMNSCCPFRWICPDQANDEIIPAESPTDNNAQCMYGDKLLNIGDRFERNEKDTPYTRSEIKCECKIPPFLTCTEKQVFLEDED